MAKIFLNLKKKMDTSTQDVLRIPSKSKHLWYIIITLSKKILQTEILNATKDIPNAARKNKSAKQTV